MLKTDDEAPMSEANLKIFGRVLLKLVKERGCSIFVRSLSVTSLPINLTKNAI